MPTQYSRIIFQSALAFKVLEDIFEKLETWRHEDAYGYGYLALLSGCFLLLAVMPKVPSNNELY